MSELVFSVEDIFSRDSRTGALGQHQQASRYFIAPYQRGYKWASNTPNAAVSVLMRDLWDAYESNSSEYYLQYITTQERSHNEEKVMEVIDGQQRLTTLTLLFAVLSNLTEEDEHNISKNKLAYQVREHVSRFFDKFVYSGIESIVGKSWEEFIATNPDGNEQDIFYLFHAVQKIYEVLRARPQEHHNPFAHYVRKNVKIILNNVDGNISCEKIFSNLNTNKVELTSSELIKGLLLTKVARETSSGTNKNFKEVLELRSIIGRQWDEIVHWANQSEIRRYYFKKTEEPIDALLLLLGKKNGFDPKKAGNDKYALFNFLQSQIKKKERSAQDLFNDLKKIVSVLNDWFLNDEIYNYLGFLFFGKRRFSLEISDILDDLELSKSEIIQKLKKLVLELLPDEEDYSPTQNGGPRLSLEYGNDEEKIHRLLLALSIFGEQKRFNFVAFNADPWTLEHIFPQNPKKLSNTLKPKDIALINSLIGDTLEDKEYLTKVSTILFDESVYASVKEKLSKDACELTDIEKEFIYKALKPDRLNSLGNMALLRSADNKSNSNGMFDYKRYNLAQRVSAGSFVPKHTYDVFSKLISAEMTPDLSVWTEKDIDVHEKWVHGKLNHITQKLNQI